MTHCLENQIISQKQAAYVRGDFTVNQLLYIIHKIKQAWTCKKVTHGVFIDVDSAFYKIWHKDMIAKLHSIGIEGKLLELLTSYLHKRKQIVVVDGFKSSITNITAGEPQSSTIGSMISLKIWKADDC